MGFNGSGGGTILGRARSTNLDRGSGGDRAICQMAETPTASPSLILRLERLQSNGERRDVGNVHLGQALELLLTVEPKTADTEPITMHVELQTGTQHTTLLDAQASPSDTHHIKWEVKELGVHVLTCSAVRGAQILGRAFFKFNVAAPFTLRTRINLVKERIYLSAQLGNASVETFRINEIKFEPAEGYSAATLDPPSMARLSIDSSAVYTDHQFILAPRCSHSYVFCLRPSEEISGPLLGRLGIRWETVSGDCGHLQTGSINLPSDHAVVESIEVSCKPVKPLRIHEPGELEFTLKNNTVRPIAEVFASLHPSTTQLIPIGESFTAAQTLAPGTCAILKLPVIPAKQGFMSDVEFIIGFTDEWVKQQNTRAFTFHVDN